MPSEKQVQNAIVEALVWDGWLVFEINQGAMEIDDRYIRFAVWQVLGIDPQDSGISDVIAVRGKGLPHGDGLTEDWIAVILAIEVKAPGKGKRLKRYIENPLIFSDDEHKLKGREKNQAKFLRAVQDHGGLAIVADDLDDLVKAGLLERIEAQ